MISNITTAINRQDKPARYFSKLKSLFVFNENEIIDSIIESLERSLKNNHRENFELEVNCEVTPRNDRTIVLELAGTIKIECDLCGDFKRLSFIEWSNKENKLVNSISIFRNGLEVDTDLNWIEIEKSVKNALK